MISKKILVFLCLFGILFGGSRSTKGDKDSNEKKIKEAELKASKDALQIAEERNQQMARLLSEEQAKNQRIEEAEKEKQKAVAELNDALQKADTAIREAEAISKREFEEKNLKLLQYENDLNKEEGALRAALERANAAHVEAETYQSQLKEVETKFAENNEFEEKFREAQVETTDLRIAYKEVEARFDEPSAKYEMQLEELQGALERAHDTNAEAANLRIQLVGLENEFAAKEEIGEKLKEMAEVKIARSAEILTGLTEQSELTEKNSELEETLWMTQERLEEANGAQAEVKSLLIRLAELESKIPERDTEFELKEEADNLRLQFEEQKQKSAKLESELKDKEDTVEAAQQESGNLRNQLEEQKRRSAEALEYAHEAHEEAGRLRNQLAIAAAVGDRDHGLENMQTVKRIFEKINCGKRSRKSRIATAQKERTKREAKSADDESVTSPSNGRSSHTMD